MPPEAPAAAGLTLLARGRTADVYAWAPGQVLKLFHPGTPPAQPEHEAHVARVVGAMGVPAPALIGTLEREGRRGIVYERIDGPSMLDVLSRRPWRVDALARRLAVLHRRVHEHRGVGLPPLGATVAARIERVDVLSRAQKDQLAAILERLAPGEVLCHCDFHPDQVLLAAGQAQVIDWITARCGPAGADVARSLIILTFGRPVARSTAHRLSVELARRRFRHVYLREYLAAAPAGFRAAVESWLLPIAAARLDEGIGDEQRAVLRYVTEGLEGQRQLGRRRSISARIWHSRIGRRT